MPMVAAIVFLMIVVTCVLTVFVFTHVFTVLFLSRILAVLVFTQIFAVFVLTHILAVRLFLMVLLHLGPVMMHIISMRDDGGEKASGDDGRKGEGKNFHG
ncbi:hypothetical protein AA15973_2395 [Komagataeibacter sucrofermentans DSM 15973]|nr:hypothetical protein AA15973_2395 [Komagataeibacter sucrofermentans DSM 15973]